MADLICIQLTSLVLPSPNTMRTLSLPSSPDSTSNSGSVMPIRVESHANDVTVGELDSEVVILACCGDDIAVASLSQGAVGLFIFV